MDPPFLEMWRIKKVWITRHVDYGVPERQFANSSSTVLDSISQILSSSAVGFMMALKHKDQHNYYYCLFIQIKNFGLKYEIVPA